MPAVKDTNLAGFTIAYNGVQFGGADATYKMMPPNYKLSGKPVYDDALRAVVRVEYTLALSTVLYASDDDDAASSTQIKALRRLLTTPGATLKFPGLGMGFNEAVVDTVFGPKPTAFDLTPLGGHTAFQLDWSIQFSVVECQRATGGTTSAFTAFNFACQWAHDLEGIETRTIQGYYEVVGMRQGNVAVTSADVSRDHITIAVPAGFRRVSNSWSENPAKNRMDFTITDQQLEADAPPPGITAISAPFSMDSHGPGFAGGTATFSMTMRTAPGVRRSRAAEVFLAAAIARQTAIHSALEASGKNAAIYASNLSVQHDVVTRDSSFSISWTLAGCVGNVFMSDAIWEPLPDSNYQKWATSMANLWGNRGTALTRQYRSEDIVIDLCSAPGTIAIGKTNADICDNGNGGGTDISKLCCKKPKPEQSWLACQVHVLARRTEHQTVARRAVAYIPAIALGNISTSQSQGVGTLLPAGDYTSQINAENKPVVEMNGLPTTQLLLQFKGLRIGYPPEIPKLDQIGGTNLVLKQVYGGAPQVVDNFFGCPVYLTVATIEYEADGYISTVPEQKNKTTCTDK